MNRSITSVSISALLFLAACGGAKDVNKMPDKEAIETNAQESKEAMENKGEAVAAEVKEGVEEVKEEVKEMKPPMFDHTAWDMMLKANVDPKTHRVNYAAIKEQEAALDAYLATIAAAKLEPLSEQERFAFYVNAYNAYTVKLILEKYPKIKSIREYKDPWKQARWSVAGETLSLDQIEHEKLRPVFKDPRIHFAVNCTSIGCPPLKAEAYVGEKLEQQLEEATKMTIGSDDYVQVKSGRLYLSSIFDWYGKDFTNPEFKNHQETVAAFVKLYAQPEVAKFIEEKKNKPKVRYLKYDWNLNVQK